MSTRYKRAYFFKHGRKLTSNLKIGGNIHDFLGFGIDDMVMVYTLGSETDPDKNFTNDMP